MRILKGALQPGLSRASDAADPGAHVSQESNGIENEPARRGILVVKEVDYTGYLDDSSGSPDRVRLADETMRRAQFSQMQHDRPWSAVLLQVPELVVGPNEVWSATGQNG